MLSKEDMKTFSRRGFCYFSLFIFFLALSASGYAQTATMTTYAGPPTPVNGSQAATQVFGPIYTVAADGAGGFYFASDFNGKIYRVANNGTLSVIAGYSADGMA